MWLNFIWCDLGSFHRRSLLFIPIYYRDQYERI
ncbi:plasmid mobilization protein [Escherichia coli]|nr:plasmid mobilization protein [Salmonella enterica]ECT2093123.1 plasmid mobilization protein [Salmonella enterica subsp. enterica serovar Montevideo]EFN9620132.1 plasmid mobilization protein [Escherichia coli]EFO0053913.1 plasmid mobilization protein [Escherichia coli]